MQILFRQKSEPERRGGCEPFRRFNRQKRYRYFWILALALGAAQNGGADAPEPLTLAQDAADLLAQGKTADAARKTQAALQTLPDDSLIEILAGAIDLQTGDVSRAQIIFENALKNHPGDALARYGRGLALLARGQRKQARQDFTQSAQCGGNANAIHIAQDYERSFDLSAGKPRSETTNSSNEISDAERALSGFRLARQDAKPQAISVLEKILSRSPADFADLPAGMRMSFEAASPFVFAARLPAELAPDADVARAVLISGDRQFSPQNAAPETAYVSYEIDAQSVGLVNVAPFAFTWDSRRIANGRHTLSIRCYDRDGAEISAADRALRVYNQTSAETQENPAAQALRIALWKILTPIPDRAALASELGELCREQGDRASAETWLWQAAALNAGNAESVKRLAPFGVRAVTEDAFYGGLPTRKEIALTFDDGPKPGLTEPLIDLLVREKAPATFFVIGRNAAANPEITRKIARAGMELANHSYTHRNLTRLSPAEVAAEMAQTQATLFALTGQRPRYMRPPGGAWNAKVNQIVRRWGLTPCFWTADVFGSEVVSSQQTAQAVIAQAKPGAIILMHNGKLSALQALPTILRELRAKGYTFVTAATLAKHFYAGSALERKTAAQNARKSRAE